VKTLHGKEGRGKRKPKHAKRCAKTQEEASGTGGKHKKPPNPQKERLHEREGREFVLFLAGVS